MSIDVIDDDGDKDCNADREDMRDEGDGGEEECMDGVDDNDHIESIEDPEAFSSKSIGMDTWISEAMSSTIGSESLLVNSDPCTVLLRHIGQVFFIFIQVFKQL